MTRLNAIVVRCIRGRVAPRSQDWAEMLMRMYLRWAEREGFKTEINEIQDGDEAGIKSATFTITGEFAFGLLQRGDRCASPGAHLAVRLRPSDGIPALRRRVVSVRRSTIRL